MADKPLPRPRQVSFSGWSIVVGSVLTILIAFQRIADLGSLESQEAAMDFISTAPGDSLGLTVDQVQTTIRLMCLVAGGVAAATAILGWQALQGVRSARVVLSVLAPILFVAGFTSGGIFSAVVAAGVVMLWTQPARDFFDGKAPSRDQERVAAMAGRGEGAGATMGGMSADHQNPYGVPAAPPPPGAPGTPGAPAQQNPYASPGQQSPYASPGQQSPYAPPGQPGAVDASQRPGRVTAAGITTLVASVLTLTGLVVSLLFITANRAAFLDQIETEMAGNAAYEDLSAGTIADVALGFLVVLAVWCVLAIVLALLVLRGSNGARIALVVSASLSALVSLLGALVIVPLVLTVASIAVVVLLLTGGVGDWFAARSRQA